MAKPQDKESEDPNELTTDEVMEQLFDRRVIERINDAIEDADSKPPKPDVSE